jgi:hypothetical protein
VFEITRVLLTYPRPPPTLGRLHTGTAKQAARYQKFSLAVTYSTASVQIWTLQSRHNAKNSGSRRLFVSRFSRISHVERNFPLPFDLLQIRTAATNIVTQGFKPILGSKENHLHRFERSAATALPTHPRQPVRGTFGTSCLRKEGCRRASAFSPEFERTGTTFLRNDTFSSDATDAFVRLYARIKSSKEQGLTATSSKTERMLQLHLWDW